MNSFFETILSLNTVDALIVAISASTIGIILTTVSECVAKLNRDSKTRKIRRRIPGYEPPVTRKFSFTTNIAICFTITAMTCLVTLLAICHEANVRTIPYGTLSIGDLPEKIQMTLKEDQLPEDITNHIIVFYKYGCPDCESIHRSLTTLKKNKDDLLFIASNSEQGEKLRETLPVTDVPCGFYIHSDGSYTNATLYIVDENGSRFDQNAMNRLLQLQAEKR